MADTKTLQDSVRLEYEKIDKIEDAKDYFLYVGVEDITNSVKKGKITIYKDKDNIEDYKVLFGITLEVDSPFSDEDDGKLPVPMLTRWIIHGEMATEYDWLRFKVKSELEWVIQPFRDYYIRMPLIGLKRDINKEFRALGVEYVPYDESYLDKADAYNTELQDRYGEYIKIARLFTNSIDDLVELQHRLGYAGGVRSETELWRNDSLGTVTKKYELRGDSEFTRHLTDVTVVLVEKVDEDTKNVDEEYYKELAKKVRRVYREHKRRPEIPIEDIIGDFI